MARRLIFAAGTISFNERQIAILLHGREGEVSQDIRRRARAVQKRAQRAAPSRTGYLRRNISVSTRYPPTGAVATITSKAPYSLAVERGRREVTPKRAPYLVWDGDHGIVVALSARAVPPRPFMVPALDEVRR